MKLSWMIVVLLIVGVAAVAFAAPPDDMFTGGEADGYDVNSTTNNVIPMPPSPTPSGTVILIQ